MNEDLLIFILEVFNRMAGPLTDQQIIDKISKEKAYFDLPSGQCYTALYYLADNKCIVWNPNPNRSENNYIINPNKNCLEFYLRRRAERLAAENPSANPAAQKRRKAITIIQKIGLWIISNIWKFIFYVVVAIAAAYLLVRLKIPH